MTIAGIMGPGEGATEEETRLAYTLGGLVAEQGWVLLTGGRNTGIMDAAGKGAKAAQGMVVGILPGSGSEGLSTSVDIPIITGMQEARNNINILSSQVLFFIGMNPGTACELALAIKHGKPAILVCQAEPVADFCRLVNPDQPLLCAGSAADALVLAKQILGIGR